MAEEIFSYDAVKHDPVIEATYNEWYDWAVHGETLSEAELELKFAWLYEFLEQKERPVVLLCDGVLEAQLFANMLKGLFEDEETLRAKLFDKLVDKLDDKLRDKLVDKLYDKLRDKLYDKMEFFHPFWNADAWSWMNYYAFYDAATKITGIEIKGRTEFKEFLKANVMFPLCFEGVIICSKKPQILLRNENNDLHSTTQAAIQFLNGEQYFFVQGISFEENEFERFIKNKPSSNDLLQLDSVEKRCVILEVHGWDLLLNEAVLIDEYKTTQKGCGKPIEFRLYKPKNASFPVHLLYGEWWEQGVKKSFVETMPNNINTCKATVAWSFNMTEAEYWDNLEVET